MKIMHPSALKRLRGSALPHTHLARYDKANDEDAKRVLDVACPYCAAAPGAQCFTGS